jgi:predicted MFS family arabinose efflux permease
VDRGIYLGLSRRGGARLPAVVIAVYLVLFVGELPYQALFPLLPTFAHDLALSKLQTSALVAAPPIGVLAASIPVAFLTERLGTRAVILGASVGLVGTSLAQVAARGFATLLLSRVALGVVHAGIWVAAPALIAGATSGKRRITATAATMPVAALGAIVAPAMGGFVGQHYGLRAPFAVAAAAAVVACLACVAAARGSAHVESVKTDPLRAFETLTASPVRAAVALTLLAALVGNVVSFLVALRLGSNGLSASAIGVVFAAAAVVLLAGSFGVAMLGRWFVTVGTGGTTALLLAGSMVIVVLSRATGPVIGFMIVKSFFLAVLYTIAYPIAATAGERGSAAALGLVSTAWAVGALCGPLAAGALAGFVGERSTYAAFLVLTALVAIGTLIDRARNRSAMLIVAGSDGA